MSEQDWLLESVKTIRNLAEIAIILREQDKNHLLPTVLELMFQECQSVVDENCVVKE